VNCLDCAQTADRDRAAVGICRDCGAAVCRDHAVVRRRRRVRLAIIMRPVGVDPPARVLRCTTCDAAYRAAPDSSLEGTT
jgi:hypothetical protein